MELDPDSLTEANRALELVSTDVEAAVVAARAVLRGNSQAAACSVAERALGLAALEVGHASQCEQHMRLALSHARSTGAPHLIAEAEMGLAAARFTAGDRRAALTLSGRAVRRSDRIPRLALQRALILDRLGLAREALSAYADAERLAQASRDHESLARTWCNRGVLHAYAARLDPAQHDLRRALELSRAEGFATLEAPLVANLGFVAARRGELIAALELLDAVTPEMDRAGGARAAIHQLDRCEVLLSTGLAGPALDAGQAAASAFDAAGLDIELGEALVLSAQAALQSGDAARSSTLARRALTTLKRRGATEWAALAEDVATRASLKAGAIGSRSAHRMAKVAGDLDAAGWSAAAASARILAARIELSLGRRAQAEAQLRLVRETPRSPVALRIQARCATALLRREAGDRRGARAALRSGWALLERHRATLGATELRAGASAHVAELVAIGLEMAIEDRRPREVLLWAERGRVGALTPRATAPPEDPELAALLGELRVVAAEADAAAKRGEDNRALLRRQAQVEERVRSRARLLPPEEAGGEPPTVAAADLLAALGDRALVQYVVSGGDLWAVIAAGGRSTLRRICTEAQISDEVDGLRVALRRLAFGSPVPQLQQAARNGALYARDRLAELIFDPIADLLGERPRVIVPMGVLHAVPWSALANPSVEQVVAPSASLWARAARGASSSTATARGRTILVAGPRLAEADAEVAAIRTLRPGAEEFGGADATVDAVREAMAGAALAHLACHGTFRADNPLFSSLELHDGALSVFELERLGRSPQQIVLSACDAGLSAVHPGDELLGLAAALLRLGTTGLVASVLPVPDAATRRLMEALHAELAAGATLAQALAAARATLDPERDDDLVASWAFQVLGAG